MMKLWNKKFFCTASCLLFLAICSIWFFSQNEEKNKELFFDEKEDFDFSGELRECKFFDEKLFFLGDVYAKKQNIEDDQVIRGGIIPHHLLPSYIINDFFHQLSFQRVETIILIGPNHNELGINSIISSDVSWKTSFGKVFSDQSIIKLLQEKEVVVDNSFIENEHSISGIIPYLSYYLPDTKVVPLVVRRNMNEDEVMVISNFLRDISKDPGVIVVASVDFSHYLTSSEAQEKNKETREIIESRDYDYLFSLDNDHLDSPQSIAILLQAMDGIGASQMNITHDTNSGQITNNSSSETTSYLGVIFK